MRGRGSYVGDPGGPSMTAIPATWRSVPPSRRSRRAGAPAPPTPRWRPIRGFQTEITPELAAFIAERDSFYLATAGADGQPYVQHRGGPKGFLKVLGPTTLAFADFGGNRQYITPATWPTTPRPSCS